MTAMVINPQDEHYAMTCFFNDFNADGTIRVETDLEYYNVKPHDLMVIASGGLEGAM